VPGADEHAPPADSDAGANSNARAAADSNTVPLRYEAKRRLQEVLNREEEHGKSNVEDF
jgi:hypothetical protein